MSDADVFAELLRAVDALLDAPASDGGGRPHTDVVADLLGHLGQRMTDLHARRQDEARRFLAWLERELGASVGTLTGAARVREYWSQDGGVEALLATIERNRPRVTALDVRVPRRYGAVNPAREAVTDAYDTSMRRLRPVLTQLRVTDALIDQLVYRLYAMTPAEVALVAGRSDNTPEHAEAQHV